MKLNTHTHTLLLLLLGLCATTLAQSQVLPACAQLCLKNAFGTDTCLPTDTACICTNPIFQGNVTACVATTCTVSESLISRNVSLTSCGAPVRNHGQDYVVLSNTMIIIAAIFVIIRFFFKGIVSRMDFGYDDWCVLATLFSATPSAVITVYGTVKNGLGRDLWTLTPQEITEMLKWFYVMATLYFVQVALLKLTLTFFCIRVFPSKQVQRLLWGTVVFVLVWGTAFVITAIFQCQPIHYFWTKWDGMHKGTCLDTNAIAASNAGISIALDLWILGIPLWQLWGLKLHWKKKVAVALMLCLGTFVTIVSMLRLHSLVHFAQTSNASWEFYNVSVWSTIEICVGIMCACLPTLRLLLVRLFPILGGSSARSTARSGNKYYNYGSGNELRNVGVASQSRRSQYNGTAITSQRGDVFDQGDGITVKTSYTVQHSKSDTDEVSLVSHEEKRPPGNRV